MYKNSVRTNMDDKWPQNAIVYHLYPRSFFDTNNDGIGDLKGITEKLDYLEDLGINTLWLSPVYPSPMVDFGYDVSDYKNIDFRFGSLSDFDELVKKAHGKKIKILMDFIPNHTSSSHEWFIKSKSSKTNSKRDFYIWADPKPDGSVPNNWISNFGGSAWTLDEKTNQYYLHTFDKEQPDLNWRNPKVVEEMLNVLRFWMDRGVDGFRVDAVYHLFKDEGLLDEPINPLFTQGVHNPYEMLQHPYTFGLPETLLMIKRFSDVLDEYPHKFMVTEEYPILEGLLKRYLTLGRKWYAPFNFFLIHLPWRPDIHKKFIDEYDIGVGHMYLPNYVLGNHDQHRVGSRLGEHFLRNAALMQLTLRGVPFIYYGEEIGMTNGDIPPDLIQDPWEKNMPGLSLGRDPERTPMQWNSSRHAGFSEETPWLPVNQNYMEKNVEKEHSSQTSLLTLYKRLLKIRHDSHALTQGVYTSLNVENENIFAYTRTYNEEEFVVVLNYSEEKQTVSLPYDNLVFLLNSQLTMQEVTPVDPKKLEIEPFDGMLFVSR